LVLDRARADGSGGPSISSIAATGFGLSALCIGQAQGYVHQKEAAARVRVTLEFLAHRAPRHKGFYFHFMHAESGQRAFRSELSSVDTAWLLCGVIHAREHFSSPEVRQLADEIVGGVQWNWMLNGGSMLSHGWTPESGFLPYRWDRYSELLAMYLLAMGAQNNAIPSSSWHAWERPITTESGAPYIESAAPLFVHQYSHAWIDFRHQQDAYADYFGNSRLATRRHRRFCLDMRDRFPWFDEQMWGITASDSRFGYIDWGGPETPANAKIDGTLVPCAAGGSIAFLPDECLSVLTTMIRRYGTRVWSRYGFIDAFNPRVGWWAPDVLGIDLGIMLLMVENLRTQSVWSAMMEAPEVRRGLRAAGFRARRDDPPDPFARSKGACRRSSSLSDPLQPKSVCALADQEMNVRFRERS
jgi:hypothetical protein